MNWADLSPFKRILIVLAMVGVLAHEKVGELFTRAGWDSASEERRVFQNYKQKLQSLLKSPLCNQSDLTECKEKWNGLRSAAFSGEQSGERSAAFKAAIIRLNSDRIQEVLKRPNQDNGKISGLAYQTDMLYEGILALQKIKPAFLESEARAAENRSQTEVIEKCRGLADLLNFLSGKANAIAALPQPNASAELHSSLVQFLNTSREKYSGGCPTLPTLVAELPPPLPMSAPDRAPANTNPLKNQTKAQELPADRVYRSAEALKLQRKLEKSRLK